MNSPPLENTPHCQQPVLLINHVPSTTAARLLGQIRLKKIPFFRTPFRTLTLTRAAGSKFGAVSQSDPWNIRYDTWIIPGNKLQVSRRYPSGFQSKGFIMISCSYFLRSSGHCGTDDAFRCALRQWEMGVVKPEGTVSSRRHPLDIRVDALCFDIRTMYRFQHKHNAIQYNFLLYIHYKS